MTKAISKKNFSAGQESYADKALKKFPSIKRALESSMLAKINGGVEAHHYASLGRLLAKTKNYLSQKHEDGTIADLGLIPQYAQDLVTIDYAQNVQNIIGNTQVMLGQADIIYYERLTATSTRGNVTAPKTLEDALAAPQVYADGYANAGLTVALGTTTTNTTYNFAAGLASVPVQPRATVVYVTQTDGTQWYAKDIDGVGTLAGAQFNGTVDYETGDVDLTFAEAPTAGWNITATYNTDIEAEGNIAKVNVDLDYKLVNAIPHALQAEVGLFKQYEANKRLGINASDRTAEKLIQEMGRETSTRLINLAVANIGAGTETWDPTTPAGDTWPVYKLGYKDTLIDASTDIYRAAGRGSGNCYIADVNGNKMLNKLPGFVAGGMDVIQGAVFSGTFEGTPTVLAPMITDGGQGSKNGTVVNIFKSRQSWDGALVLGVYMPIISVKDIANAQNILQTVQGVAAWQGYLLTSPLFVSQAKIQA
jgi:hypothetical protein